MTIKELKTRAKRSLNGNYTSVVFSLVLGMFIWYAFSFLCNIIVNIAGVRGKSEITATVLIIIMFLCVAGATVSSLIMLGISKQHLNLCKNMKTGMEDLFYAFKYQIKQNLVFSFLVIFVITTVAVFCIALVNGAILLEYVCKVDIFFAVKIIIIVIMVAFAFLVLNYGVTDLLLLDDFQQGIIDAFRMSRKIMHGRKRKFFGIGCSFLIWQIINLCTFGIASLWIVPYFNCVRVHMYLEAKKEYLEKYLHNI